MGRRKLVALSAIVVSLVAVAPASGAIVINEVESKPTDWVELYNSGPGVEDISGWKVDDASDNGAPTTLGAVAPLQAGDYYVVTNPPSLGNPDGARVFDGAS